MRKADIGIETWTKQSHPGKTHPCHESCVYHKSQILKFKSLSFLVTDLKQRRNRFESQNLLPWSSHCVACRLGVWPKVICSCSWAVYSWLDSNTHLRLLRSPDFLTCDFYLWGMLKRRALVQNLRTNGQLIKHYQTTSRHPT